MVILDTNILVAYSRRENRVVEAIHIFADEPRFLATTTIVEAELLSWPKLTKHDEEIISNMLAEFLVHPVDSPIAQIAAEFRREYKIHLLDATIAASAYIYRATLVTRNLKDFKKIKEIDVIKI